MGLSSKQVSNDVKDWSQGLLHSTSDDSNGSSMELPKPPMKRQQQENLQPPAEKLKCPRCDSSNTKFCYYNNYNKSQPRHFCKACKRHWTKGGMLRNVPVGGGRKNKRLKTSPKITTSVQASDHSLPLRLESENSMRKIFNHVIPRPQSIAQDGLFNNTLDNSYGIFGGSSIPQNHDLQFPCPSFITLDENFPCSISSSTHISNPYNALDESVDLINGSDHTPLSMNDKAWPSNESVINWGWDDIENFITADITIPWDDAEL